MSGTSGIALKLLAVFLGAGVGGAGRYLIGGWVQGMVGPGFPIGTLVVNVSGCLAIGFAAALFEGSSTREDWRLAITAGLLGGYTTFSAFGRETLELSQAGRWTAAGTYVALTNVIGLAAVWAGWTLGKFAAARPTG